MRVLGIFALLGVLLTGGVLAYFFLSGGDYVIELHEDDLQRWLNEEFPIEKRVLVTRLQLTEPRVSLHEGSDRLDFSVLLEADVTIGGQPLRGSANVETGVRYDPEPAALFLDRPEVRLDLAGLDDKHAQRLQKLAETLLEEYLGRHAVYHVDPSDLDEALARWEVKSVSVGGGAVEIRLGLR